MTSKDYYLKRIKELGIQPNFFISLEYLDRPSIKLRTKEGWMWFEEDGIVLFPAIPYRITHSENPIHEYWAGFPDTVQFPKQCTYEFLDYQYIYDPKAFLDLSGGRWEVFRKNIRKFQKLYNPTYTSRFHYHSFQILINTWFEKHQNDVQDGDYIYDCINSPGAGNYIKYLFANDRMVALNYADENHQYINYRFILTDGTPLADEYARWCFYTDPEIQQKNKLVNDGGVLDNPGLKKFKDKLNPYCIHSIYSSKIIKYENSKTKITKSSGNN